MVSVGYHGSNAVVYSIRADVICDEMTVTAEVHVDVGAIETAVSCGDVL